MSSTLPRSTRRVCQVVSPPRVATASAAMECELLEAIALGTGPGGANLVIGRIVWIHLADRLIDSTGDFDARQLDTIGRMGGDDYVRTSERFTMPRPPRPTSDKGGKDTGETPK